MQNSADITKLLQELQANVENYKSSKSQVNASDSGRSFDKVRQRALQSITTSFSGMRNSLKRAEELGISYKTPIIMQASQLVGYEYTHTE